DLGRRVRRLRARRRVVREQLEVVLARGMVDAQAHEARGDLGAEAPRDVEPGRARAARELGRGRVEADAVDAAAAPCGTFGGCAGGGGGGGGAGSVTVVVVVSVGSVVVCVGSVVVWVGSVTVGSGCGGGGATGAGGGGGGA